MRPFIIRPAASAVTQEIRQKDSFVVGVPVYRSPRDQGQAYAGSGRQALAVLPALAIGREGSGNQTGNGLLRRASITQLRATAHIYVRYRGQPSSPQAKSLRPSGPGPSAIGGIYWYPLLSNLVVVPAGTPRNLAKQLAHRRISRRPQQQAASRVPAGIIKTFSPTNGTGPSPNAAATFHYRSRLAAPTRVTVDPADKCPPDRIYDRDGRSLAGASSTRLLQQIKCVAGKAQLFDELGHFTADETRPSIASRGRHGRRRSACSRSIACGGVAISSADEIQPTLADPTQLADEMQALLSAFAGGRSHRIFVFVSRRNRRPRNNPEALGAPRH